MELLKCEPFPRPPADEQAAIMRFLDHADGRIRRYILAKQKLIKLLEEQKQAIIHRAVTRGLDPNVRLKPSGVEWLGDVPEHWEVRRLGRIARVFNGTTPSRMKSVYWNEGTVPWLSSGKVNDYVVETASELVTEQALRECSISIVPKGAVIIGLVGQGKTRGKSAILGIDACINQNLAAVIPLRSLNGIYLHHFLTAFYKMFREFGRGGNQEALNCEIVANFRIAIPPGDEQIAICDYLRVALAGVQETEERISHEISLLREYRTCLIADVVTGNLDVRAAAARLPDEGDEPEPLDDAEALADGDEETEVQDPDVLPEEAEA
jgi:type I restriction enzyme S subunit